MQLSLLLLALGAAAFGGLVGATELADRYRDRPWEVIKGAGRLYVALNAAAAVAAFVLVRALGWRFGIDPADGDSGALRATQLLVAGFGSVALFRSSLFTVRAGDQDIGIGPSAVLTVALRAADRAADRARGIQRSTEVQNIMAKVSFAKAAEILPMYCFEAGLQNVSEDEQRSVGQAVKTLKDSTVIDDSKKALMLGATLLTIVGPDMLREAVRALGDSVTPDP